MRRIATLGAAAVVAALLAVPARAATPARCDALALSPAFDRDGAGLCVARRKDRIQDPSTGVEVWTTTDRGRTWQRRAAVGLAWDERTAWSQVAFSPAYPKDPSVYVHGSYVGLFRTTDGGATFLPVDPTLTPNGSRPGLSPVPDPPPPVPPGGAAGGLLHASRLPSLLHPPVRRPVPGPAGAAEQFLVPRTPGAPVIAVAQVPGWHYSFTTCTAAYACADEFFALDRYWRPLGVDLVGLPGRERLVVVAEAAIGPDAGKIAVWRSGDALTRMERYGALERVLPGPADGFRQTVRSVGVATTADGRLLATVSSIGHTAATPSRQLFAADPAGNRWTRIAYGRGITERRYGPAGTMPPSNGHAESFNQTRIWAARDRMFTLGTYGHDGVAAVFCSRDRGRTWRYSC